MKNTRDVSSPPLEAVPGDKIFPEYKVKLGLRATKLFAWTGTPATLLVPEALVLVMEKSSTHLGCLNSAVRKVKTWLTGEEN